MPELPEVETVRRGLQELIIGRTVKHARELDSPKSFPNAPGDVSQFLIGASVLAVRRRAKVLLIDLSTEYTLVIHLKMTGQLVFVGVAVASPPLFLETASRPTILDSSSGIDGAADASKNKASERHDAKETRFGAGHPNDSLIAELPDRSTRVVIEFTDGSHLYFNDQRKFGWVKLFATIEVPNIDFMQKVGPEPLETDFTSAQFAERFKRRAKTNIKAALLDQTVVAGVGNIYADESLWGAQIDPHRLVGSLTIQELVNLYESLRAVMNLAIDKGGSTDKNYVNAEGKRGSYMDFASVFRREGKECPRCGHIITKIRWAGRGTHLCANCQK
jgi:formamidopyrimidine-DNA glycosylase